MGGGVSNCFGSGEVINVKLFVRCMVGFFGVVGSGKLSLHSFCGVCGGQFFVCVGSGEALFV